MAYALGFPKNITDLIYELRDWPPRRPRHTSCDRPGRNAFLMDFENSCLSDWDSFKRPHPKGPNRHLDPEWAAMIKSQVYPYHSDVDWEEYQEWCRYGGGDECFEEDDE